MAAALLVAAFLGAAQSALPRKSVGAVRRVAVKWEVGDRGGVRNCAQQDRIEARVRAPAPSSLKVNESARRVWPDLGTHRRSQGALRMRRSMLILESFASYNNKATERAWELTARSRRKPVSINSRRPLTWRPTS
jgi:hypothetical protein